MQSGTRKRRRQSENATMASLDLPDIPGVPLDVLPEFVHAIRVATRFFARCHGKAYFGEEGKESHNDEDRSESSPVVWNVLMDRVAAATEPTTNPDEDELAKRKQAMDDAVGRWLKSVKGFAKSAERRKQRQEQAAEDAASVGKKDSERKSAGVSVPHACFLYIWELQQTHERIAVRRAGLYLTGLLLQRSRDCRFHLEQDNHLGTWLEAAFFSYQPQKAAGDLHFLHLEADFWLSHLVDNGYGRMYPKIQVALQRLRQRFPNLEAKNNNWESNVSASEFSSMSEWRHIRDIALLHGDKEIKHVEKWVGRAHACMEILVPRLGMSSTQASQPSGDFSNHNDNMRKHGDGHGTHTAATDWNDDSDDDDELHDIDWEDGCIDDVDDRTADFDHFYAVERTLAVMETSAGGLRGGGIEIDFRDNSCSKTDDESDIKRSDAISEEERSAALARFTECARVLTKSHMPRLTVWLEGLTNADNLVASRRSLVSLPSDAATKRTNLVRRLAELRESVSAVLSSARRLQPKSSTEGADVVAEGERAALSDDAPLILRLATSSKKGNSGRETLLSTIHRQRKSKCKGARSSEIRIKFHAR